MRIAIQPDLVRLKRDPHQSFSERWVELLQRDGHEVRLVDATRPDFFDALLECDGFLWWYPPIPRLCEPAKRIILALNHARRFPTFPDWKSAWHYDDKVAQGYLLEAAGLPRPRTNIFWRLGDALEFFRTAEWPLVLKLASGYRSQNVALLRDRKEAEAWARKLFGPGSRALDDTLLRRVARRVRKSAPPPLHQGYMLVQEFVAGNAFDTRVTVIGDRVWAMRRFNRPGDFRASGGGLYDVDAKPVERDAIELGIRAARALDATSLCVDVLRRNGEPVISELSYYYEGWGISVLPGHWRHRDGTLTWVEGSSRAEDAILETFLSRISEGRGWERESSRPSSSPHAQADAPRAHRT